MSYTTLISTTELAEHMSDPDWVVFDCRFDLMHPEAGEQAYREGHIPGARYAHLERDLSAPLTPGSGRHPLPDPSRFADWLGSQGVSNSTQAVVYDDTAGAIAGRLWWMLRWLGHRGVALLDGGLQAWRDDGHALRAAPPVPQPRRFEARLDPALSVVTEELTASLQAGRYLIMDARSPERFRGEQEPIDKVAGRIPGAINRPFQANLDTSGHFLSAERLRAQYLDLLASRDPTHVAVMCGSGVTACHNLLAMEIAGLSGARLYAGSWSEWIADPERPVATGPA